MNDKGILSSGFDRVTHNKRYIFWFWLLSLTLGEFGTSAFRTAVHANLDHSVYANGLLHGFDLAVFAEILTRPQFGDLTSMTSPALFFSFLFLVATVLLLPGVFAGYASTYRLPRQDFFRACGRNLWRFVRLMIISGFIMGIVAGILFAISGAIAKRAGDSTNELLPFILQMIGLTNEQLPFILQMIGLAIIFLIMTVLRIWFDLAEVETVLNDQPAVRRSLASAWRHTFRSLGRLLGSYVLTTIVAAIVLACGLLIWMKLISPENVIGAFLISQITLLLLLVPRFWQRGVAVAYWQQHMLVPITPTIPVEPVIPIPVAPSPVSPPSVGPGEPTLA